MPLQTYIVTVNESGDRWWFQNGQLHRIDGPAVEWVDGSRKWYQNGQLHRIDGPAVEWVDGILEWYLNGQRLSEKNWKNRSSLLPAKARLWKSTASNTS